VEDAFIQYMTETVTFLETITLMLLV